MRVFGHKSLVHISSFAVGTGMQAALGFLSIPLLVRLLGQEELGRWSVLEALFQIGAQVALLGFNQTLIKFITADGMAPWPSLIKVARTLVPVMLIIAMAAGIAGQCWLGLSLASAAGLGALLVLECWIVLGLSASRAASMPLVFSTALIVRGGAILAALATAVFLIPASLSQATQVIWVWIGVYLLVGTVLAVALSRRGASGLAPDRKILVDGLKYGAPLLVALLLAQLLQYADRFLVAGQMGYGEAGRYFIHAKVANTLAMAALPVQLWWPVARFQHLKDADGGSAFFARASVVGIAFFSVVLLVVAVLGPLVFRWFAPTAQLDVWLLLLLLAAIYIQASTVFFNVGLLEQGATHLNAVVWGFTALVQLSLQWVLVPYFGVLGAAGGLLAGAFCAWGCQFLLSQRHRFVRYPLEQLLALVAAAFAGAALILRNAI